MVVANWEVKTAQPVSFCDAHCASGFGATITRQTSRMGKAARRAAVGSASARQALNRSPFAVLEAVAWGTLFVSVALAFSRAVHIQFTLPKLVALSAVTPFVVIAWTGRAWRRELVGLPRAAALSLVAYVGWTVAATWFAVDTSTALNGMPGRYNGLLNQLLLLSLFLAVATSGWTRAQVERVIALQVIALVPVAVYAIARALGYDATSWPEPRPVSTIGNPVQLAALLALATPFAIAFLVRARTRSRVGWAAVLALFVWAIAATMSRGPWVGLAVAVGVMAAAIASDRRRAGVRPVTAIAILVVAGGLGLSALAMTSAGRTAIVGRVGSIAHLTSDEGMVNRFTYVDAAMRMIRDHPVTGIGLESFALLYPRYRPVEPEAIAADQLPTMVHDEYLQMAVSSGIPALVAYLLLVGSVVFATWRASRGLEGDEANGRIVAVAFVASIVGYLVQQVSGWQELAVAMFFWVDLGAALAYAATTPVQHARPPISPRWRTAGLVGGGVVIAGSCALAAQAVDILQADARLFDADRLPLDRDWPAVAGDVESALTFVPGNAHYEDAAGVIYLKRVAAVGDRAAYARAAEWLDRAAHDNRFDPYILIHRVDLETVALQAKIDAGGGATVASAIDRLVPMDPNNATVRESIARLRLAQGRAREALDAIRQAEALRPRHPRYHMIEGDALRALGDRKASIEAYRAETAAAQPPGAGDWLVAERKLILALLEAGRPDEAAAEADAVVRVTPSDSLAHTLLGLAWSAKRDPERARVAFARAIDLDPSNTAARQALAEMSAADQK